MVLGELLKVYYRREQSRRETVCYENAKFHVSSADSAHKRPIEYRAKYLKVEW